MQLSLKFIMKENGGNKLKLIIIQIQLDAFGRTPVQVQLMLVNELGTELSRFWVPVSLFSNKHQLAVGIEITLVPKSV